MTKRVTPLSAPASVSFTQRLWAVFLKTAGAREFYRIFGGWIRPLAVLSLIALLVGMVWGLAFAPPDYLQGNSYRIMFIHVPAAMLAQSAYLGLAILGLILLVWKLKTAEYVARALAPVGLVACVIALLTGSIWGRPTWGTYWVWDARITSMLILAFLYAGVMGLYAAGENRSQTAKAAALLSIIGAVNLPIIKYSVEWWNTLHQGATFTLTEAPKMHHTMYLPLIPMVLGVYLGAAALVLYHSRTLILAGEQRHRWVQQILTQLSSKIP